MYNSMLHNSRLWVKTMADTHKDRQTVSHINPLGVALLCFSTGLLTGVSGESSVGVTVTTKAKAYHVIAIKTHKIRQVRV